MNLRRRAVGALVGALGAQVALAAIPLAAPDAATWTDIDRWYLEVGPAVATMTALSLVARLAAAWLALAAGLQVLAARGTRPRLAVLADRVAPGFLRSVAGHVTSLSLGVTLLAPALPVLGSDPPPGTAVMVPLDAGSTSSTNAAPERTSSSSTSTTATVPPTAAASSTTSTTTLAPRPSTTPTVAPSPATPARPALGRPPAPAEDEVIVRPGDSFWSIAEDEADGDVGSFWLALIEENRDRLVDPGNPDLLYPEQVLRLPAR